MGESQETQFALIRQQLMAGADQREETLVLLQTVSSQVQATLTQLALMVQRLESGAVVMEQHGARIGAAERDLLALAFFRQSIEGTEQNKGVLFRLGTLEKKETGRKAIVGFAAILWTSIIAVLAWFGGHILDHFGWPGLK